MNNFEGDVTRIPRHQLSYVEPGDEFSANGFDFKTLAITESAVVAKVIADNRNYLN